MKKAKLVLAIGLLTMASSFADGVKVSGFLRAGFSSTFEDDPQINVKKWTPGIFFNGDSSGTRARVNIDWSGTNEQTQDKYGAFIRLQYSGTSNEWNYGGVEYAQAYAGFWNNVVTINAGKIKDNWINSQGFEGNWSVVDKKGGALINIAPIPELSITAGALVYDASDLSLNEKAFFGGIKFKNEMIMLTASYAGYGLLTAGAAWKGTENLTLNAEAKIDTKETLSESQRGIINEYIKYTGVENWTFGLVAFQTIDKKSVASSNDVLLTFTPAVAYKLNDVITFQLEGTYNLPIYDNAPNSYATICPMVKLSASKTAYATLWGSISTDVNQEKSSAGIGIIKEF